MAPQIETLDLEDFVSQHVSDGFESYGYAHLKITKGDHVYAVRVKVGSVPHEEIERLRKGAPRPPSIDRWFDPTQDRDTANALGIQSKQRLRMPDFSNTDYLDALQAFNMRLQGEIVGRGVLSKLVLKDGTVAQTPEQKYQALQEMGLSLTHLAEISTEVLRLTDWSDEERDRFLPGASAPKEDRSTKARK